MRIRDGKVGDLRWRNKVLTFYTWLLVEYTTDETTECVQGEAGGCVMGCVDAFIAPFRFRAIYRRSAS